MCTSLSKMFWIRLSNIAGESGSFHGRLSAVSRMFVGSRIAPHLCSGLSRHTSRVAFPRNATQGKESSNNNFTAVTRAQLLLSFHDMQNVSQSSPSSPSPLSPALSIIVLSSQCVAPTSVIIVWHSEVLTDAPTPSKPPLGALSPLPSLSPPGRNGQRWPGDPEWGCALLWLAFQMLVCAKPLECSDLPKKYKKMLRTAGSSRFLRVLFPTPQLPAKRSPPRRPPPSKPPPEPRSDAAPRRCTRGLR